MLSRKQLRQWIVAGERREDHGAAEYAGDGIRMNIVACGAIATAVANTTQPDTGQSLVIDGGVTVRGPFSP